MNATINGIDRALKKGEILQENRIFHRGDSYDNLKHWGFPDYKSLKAFEGNVFTCNNYISTGVSKEGSFDKMVEWKFKCDAGRNYGAYINEISEYYKSPIEYEFLIKRGANIRIDKVTLKNNKTYVDATIIDFTPTKMK